MAGFYARWIERWENHLAARDSNRIVRPFDWGLDWLGLPPEQIDPLEAVRAYAAKSVEASGEFFSYERPIDYCLKDSRLSFTSALKTPYPENNVVHARYFPARNHRGRAVVVLPQWNADAAGHLGLCKLLQRNGISSLRMSLAYHDHRMPPETERADYHVSSNIGRTVHAGRQSVIDTRSCLDWLEQEGYTRVGVLGTSLGSCIAFITAVHDARVRVAILNHVSTWFGDVVWTGLSTRHVRMGFGRFITQDDLRACWAPISPAAYWDRLKNVEFRALLIWATYDTTFLPRFSREVIRSMRERGAACSVLKMPCGHYTIGQFPFMFWDGLAMCRFAAQHL